MKPSFRVFVAALSFLLLCSLVFAENPKPGKNDVMIRDRRERVYWQLGEGAGSHQKILFAPGDGGCRGFAITITKELATSGFDVYCLDIRHYLESFTGPAVLTTKEIASDFNQIARWARQGSQEKIFLVGWSEGAGLGLAAIAEAANQDVFAGMVAIGMPEQNILAWHWTDIGAELTKSLPHEPTFRSAEFIAKVSPRPLFVIASTSNEYITPEATRALFSVAREPKRLVMIDARDHKYSGNTESFFRALREGLNWIQRYEQ
jgi:pimeloyl-ACP methyl ester carboxylesterase